MDDRVKIQMIKNRLTAIYHNCHSSACFNRADCDESDDSRCELLLGGAHAYEQVAGWIKSLIDRI